MQQRPAGQARHPFWLAQVGGCHVDVVVEAGDGSDGGGNDAVVRRRPGPRVACITSVVVSRFNSPRAPAASGVSRSRRRGRAPQRPHRDAGRRRTTRATCSQPPPRSLAVTAAQDRVVQRRPGRKDSGHRSGRSRPSRAPGEKRRSAPPSRRAACCCPGRTSLSVAMAELPCSRGRSGCSRVQPAATGVTRRRRIVA